MAQSFLLKTDAAIINNIAGENRIKPQGSDKDPTKTESFSSALDKQVDRQADKKAEKVSTADKTAKSDKKNAKESADELTETNKNAEDTDKEAHAVDGEKAGSVENKESISDDDIADAQDAALILAGQTDAIKDNNIKTDNNKHITEDNKLTGNVLLSNKTNAELLEQEGETPEKKQGLRSDILNALSNKLNTQGEKAVSVVNKEGLTDKQKMIALANHAQLKDSLLSGGGLERSTSASSALQTATLTSNGVVGTATASGQPILNLQPSLQSEAWGRVLSSRVVWMAREGVQQASLKLNPASMGLVEVKLHLHNEQASISFIAHHAATRDALEQALPRLRDSFQENGMELAHADVSQENFSEADEQNNNKTTNNDSTSRRNKNDADVETTAHDVNITEQDITLGVSVFA